ncbi:MAG: PIN domain-containing protein [Rhodocyclaceae bacterium]|jgi:toxin-antitoxin system PIN domain toxin|nr:PIN domain-containing protein [Rhodocyclaceae bacterium]
MIAVDTNLLVYAHREDSPFHARAYAAIESLAVDPAPWAIPWPCLHEFYAIVTHPRIYAPPTPIDLALEQIDAWLESPSLVLLGESELHWPELRALIAQGRISGPQAHDARIAALCLQHGVKKLWTADRDFGRFPRLNCFNPLIDDSANA